MQVELVIKNFARNILYHSGLAKSLLYFVKKARHPILLIFRYHKVCPSLNSYEYISTPDYVFEEEIKFIKDNFKAVSIKEGLDIIDRKDSNGIYAAVNLDDGYMDNYFYAFPILKKYKMPADIFLTTGYIGKEHVFWWSRVFNIVTSLRSRDMKINIDSKCLRFKLNNILQKVYAALWINRMLVNKNNEEIEHIVSGLEEKFLIDKRTAPDQMLDWDKIKQMDNGLIDFGCHTKTHRNLCLLGDDEIADELINSKKEIERKIGRKVPGFAYPFGIFDERVKGFVEKAGFDYSRTCINGYNSNSVDRFLLESVSPGYSFKTSFFVSQISFSFLLSRFRRSYGAMRSRL